MANRTFWKLGWKNILHNPVLNLLTLLQMTAVFFIAVSLTSGICSRFDDYRPFRQLLSSDGVYFNMIYGMNPETGITLNRKDLAANLQGDPDIAGMYLVWAEYDKNDGSNDLYYSADDALLRLYTPALAEGEWFPETLPADGTIPVVVSQNQYDLHPGDAIELETFGYEEKLHGKIIGVMAEGARYISGTAGGDISAKSLYSRHYLAIEEKTLFLMPQSLIGDGERAVTQLHGALFVTYKNATADEQAANLDFLKRVSNTGWSTNADIRKYSRDYIFEECRLLFPILLAVFIMTVVGSMSVNALMAKRRLRSFAVFYICGLKWHECAKISLLSSAIIGLLSLVLTVGGIGVLQHTALLRESVTRLGAVQIAVLLGILLLYMALAAALPIRLIRSRTPIQVLHAN